MRRAIAISILIWFVACRSAAVQVGPSGEYATKGKDYEYYLNLRADSSFTYRERNMEVTSEAKGRWRYLADTIYLIRDSGSLAENLSSGYMNNAPDKAFFRGKKAINIGPNVLKRK